MASILKVDTIQDQSGNNIINENADTITIGASGVMSKIEVDAIEPQSGTTLTIGASGDSVNIASGATITDFTSTGIDDNATSTAITIDSE
jgi:hypothetical protein